jgi:hypothetical protein
MKRIAGNLSFSRCKSSTVQSINTPNKLEKITELSKNHPDGIIDRNIYSLM